MSLAALRARQRGHVAARRLPRPVIILASLALAGVVLLVFGSSFLDVYRLGREAARLETMKRNLQEQNAVLREEIKLLQTPQYVEKLAREQLGLVRPGEVAILIIHPVVQPPRTPATLQKDPAPWPRRAWRAILRQLPR